MADDERFINYEALNEEFGDADVSDEEDMIMKENEDAKSAKSRIPNKYEKMIKTGMVADDKYMFPNYFVSMKSRAKITKIEEEEGNKVLLGLNDKKGGASKVADKKKAQQNKKKAKSRKAYDSDGLSNDEFEAEDAEMMADFDTIIKHKNKKEARIERIIKDKTLFNKMKYMLDCGFNLLVYGVGSKFDMLNLFA